MLAAFMNALRGHYLLGYAILGATGPYLPQFLQSARGLDDRQIGSVLAVSQVPVFFAPVLLTYLADRRLSPRRLALATFALIGVALWALSAWDGFAGVMLASAAYTFGVAALLPSTDGMCFAWRRAREEAGREAPPYHHFRMLGSLGYVVPSLVLLLLLRGGGDLTLVIFTALGFTVLAALNATKLPETRLPVPAEGRTRLPAAEALRILFSRRWIALSAALALLQVGNSCHYAVFPVHLTQSLGLEPRWLGMVSTLGVGFELPLILGLGWLTARLGLRRVILLGAVASMLRLALLALAPNAGVAIATQVLHGLVVVGTMVAPVVFVNHLAGDGFRHSMQGVLAVAVTGPCKFLGPLVNGWLAQIDHRLAFAFAAVLAGCAAVLLWRLVAEAPGDRALD